MKKKKLILLAIACVLSLCVFIGLLIYAFDLQAKKDSQNKDGNPQNQADTGDTGTGDTPDSASPAPTQPASQGDSSADGQNTASDSGSGDTGDPAGSPDTVSVSPAPTTPPVPSGSNSSGTEPIVLAFAGDVNLDEASYPAKKYDAEGEDITKCLSSELLDEMNSADIMMLNNEFAYSTRGTKTPDKSYTFRADPGRVEILKKMGVDIVSLANNHALDYGPDALLDTFDTLDDAGIDYVGAGRNLDRAKAPIYYTIGNKKLAFVAASRVVFAMDWYASEDGLGMVGTYDPALILESVKEAKANSDFVVIFLHWGVERSNYPVDYQKILAEKYIDAGADAVIGCHPHVMQGLEFYKGKPIAYSLSNFWFNNSTRESGLLKLYLDPDETVRVQLLPAMNKSTYTYLLTDETKKQDYYDFIEDISYGVSIDENGFVTEAE
jgi:poly-gamma-glutamate synthesis protein (capsule biosynthesis protein)